MLAIIIISGIPVKIAIPVAIPLNLLGPIDVVACRVPVSIVVVPGSHSELVGEGSVELVDTGIITVQL